MEVPFEIVGDPSAGPFVFTCEHATNLLPEWTPDAADRLILDDHWGWDIGAADLTRSLAGRTGSAAVLSRFSRLVCDPNREPGEESLIVAAIDGYELSFNRLVDGAERERRLARYFEPFHDAVDRTLAARLAAAGPARLCSVHSFTPSYLGRTRPMEVGVLFDDFDEIAWKLEGALAEQGFEVASNAPYSGYDGRIYSARRHGRRHETEYLELEVRQDLIDTAAKAEAVAERIAAALETYAP